MLTKKHIKEEISSNRLLIRQHGISKIGLFGSYSRQEQNKGSDIDTVSYTHLLRIGLRSTIPAQLQLTYSIIV